jgi:hypothetical protein
VPVRLPAALLAAFVLLAALPACSGRPAPAGVAHPVTTSATAPTTTTEEVPNLLWRTPPAQVWPTLVRAVANAEDVHVTGQIVEDGETVDLDVRLQGRGTAECTLKGRSLGTITAKRTAGTLYLNGDARAFERFLPNRPPGGVGPGNWLVRPLRPDDPLVDQLFLSAEGVMGIGRMKELYAGRKTMAGRHGLRDYQNGEGQPHYHVPELGEPRPSTMERTSDEQDIDLSFEYDQPWTLTLPAEAVAPA